MPMATGVSSVARRKGRPATPSRRFLVSEAARTDPSPAPPRFAQKVEVRAGISPYGFHVFVSVTGDPHVLVEREDLTQGDAVEIFVRGTPNRELTGDLAADEALHVVITPPTTTSEGLGAQYYEGKRAAPLRDDLFHSRRVRDGYEVELHYPWTELKNQSSPGMNLGFNVAIDVKDDPAATSRELRALMHVQPVASSPACDVLMISRADPLCDDRTWCFAKAYVR